VIDLVFDVARIDFPVRPERHARKIWNHIDEGRIDASSAAMWVRNGMRIGVGTPEAWPAIRAIAVASQAQVRRDPLVAQPGQPLAIELAAVAEDESIFCFDRSGRLVGKTFSAGSKVLTIEYLFHPDLGRCTDLQVSFEIRRDHGVMTWERREGILQQVPSHDRHAFAELAAVLTLRPDEFLVIGVGEPLEHEYLLGGRLFTQEVGGRRLESVLCVTPRPYQTETVRGRSS
jgi:hypothetical protein